ncbi:MAG TPA: hypothetical protein PLY68_00535 [Myxococcota bacterium]|nr:hypothetical protein [Myxococcota bacterium]HOD06808.1 hypothetical protein [Myxococcota bacterium]HPB49720.1 hypothetical protein [Myxococcota bacterium]HQP94664.1 hypothetical protein [Myxococcota bacterium]
MNDANTDAVPDQSSGPVDVKDDVSSQGFYSSTEFYLWVSHRDFVSGLGDSEIYLIVSALYVTEKQADLWADAVAESMQLFRVYDDSSVSIQPVVSVEFRDENRDLKISMNPSEELNDDDWYELAFGIPESAKDFLVAAPSYRMVDGKYRLRFKKGHDASVGAVSLGMNSGSMYIWFSERLFAADVQNLPEFEVFQEGSSGACAWRVPDSAWLENGSEYAKADCHGIYPSESLEISIGGTLLDESLENTLQPDNADYRLVIEPQDWLSCEREGLNNPTCRIFHPVSTGTK